MKSAHANSPGRRYFIRGNKLKRLRAKFESPMISTYYLVVVRMIEGSLTCCVGRGSVSFVHQLSGLQAKAAVINIAPGFTLHRLSKSVTPQCKNRGFCLDVGEALFCTQLLGFSDFVVVISNSRKRVRWCCKSSCKAVVGACMIACRFTGHEQLRKSVRCWIFWELAVDVHTVDGAVATMTNTGKSCVWMSFYVFEGFMAYWVFVFCCSILHAAIAVA